VFWVSKIRLTFAPPLQKDLTDPDMTVTRLKRKHRKNIARANNKQRIIKQLLLTPVLKNVDIEELKASFNGGAAPAPSATKAEKATARSQKQAEANTAAENAASFDDAEAVTKPVNEDGQEGEHPKPEIAL
jgi:ribosomal protein L12E/L44/L45/RPP1/RPP2